MKRSGVTLIELMIVMAIISLIVGIAFPSVSSGLDGIRLQSSADAAASFLNSAMNRAQRREQAVEVEIDPRDSRLVMRSSEPGFRRELKMPDGVIIGGEPRLMMLMPGGTTPRMTIELTNKRGGHKRVSVDPITGAPEIGS